MTTMDHGLARRMWHQLGRVAEPTGPLLSVAFGSGLLPGQSTLGIAAVAFPAPRS